MTAWLVIGLALAAAAAFLHRVLRGRRGSKVDVPTFTIEGPGDFDVEVVGESHYQEALRGIVKGKGYVREQYSARLVCEDRNRHDSSAVRVDIMGRTVGYLPRATAVEYRRVIASKCVGTATGIVQAVICGGSAEKPSYGVWLDT